MSRAGQEVAVYRCADEWCYALVIGGEFDHSDCLGIPDGDTEATAIAEAGRMFPGAAVRRVADCTADGEEE